ncbi:MAG: cyclic nucleotide-binding domain-containing protein [Solirubrobacteraceae bacterium]
MSAGQTTPDLPPQVVQFLHEHRTLTLATASPVGVPRASTFLYVNDGPNLYFWSRATTMTARQIQQNPVVAFTIDHDTEDLSRTQGVQGIGECSVLLSGEQIARVADLFGQKFPALSPGSTMSISFFRITPTEVQFIDNTAASARSEGTFGAEFHRERSYSVITDLPTVPADSIVAWLQRLEVPAGETIVRQGAPADRFFILVEGEADVSRDDGGEPHPVASLSAGQLFGEVAIMRDLPRTATVRAKTDTKLLALERDTFRDLIAQSMEITPDFDQLIRGRLDARSGD